MSDPDRDNELDYSTDNLTATKVSRFLFLTWFGTALFVVFNIVAVHAGKSGGPGARLKVGICLVICMLALWSGFIASILGVRVQSGRNAVLASGSEWQ